MNATKSLFVGLCLRLDIHTPILFTKDAIVSGGNALLLCFVGTDVEIYTTL